MGKVPVGGGQEGGASEAGRGSARSRGSGSRSCETSRALDSCLRSAGRLGHSDRLGPAGRGSPAGVSGSVLAGHGRPDGVPLTAGEAVARCGTCTCEAIRSGTHGAVRSGAGGAGDGTGGAGATVVMGVMAVMGGAGLAAGDPAATRADAGRRSGRRVGSGAAVT